ncbi:hypothetical protein [Streptomyces chryseus]|uniref:hypothetical protein n=1 Tax=Streptomyces chryseus TaxID=68186 RepID=UPI001E40CC11|nr:hypothetical protein [Streptomyces chryseus]
MATLDSIPGKDTHWSRASMAARPGLSKSTIGRIWKRFDLKPHLQDAFTLSTDPQFVAKVVDIVGLYHHPPEKAVVLCVDEKAQIQAQIQALDRSLCRSTPESSGPASTRPAPKKGAPQPGARTVLRRTDEQDHLTCDGCLSAGHGRLHQCAASRAARHVGLST